MFLNLLQGSTLLSKVAFREMAVELFNVQT